MSHNDDTPDARPQVIAVAGGRGPTGLAAGLSSRLADSDAARLGEVVRDMDPADPMNRLLYEIQGGDLRPPNRKQRRQARKRR